MNSEKNSSEAVLKILQKVIFPGRSKDIVSLGVVKDIDIENSKLSVHLSLKGVQPQIAEFVKKSALDLIKSESDFKHIAVEAEIAADQQQKEPADKLAPKKLTAVDNVIAISSTKGGVGKSTVAVNLAITAAQNGFRVGLLDCDIYGPSLPTLLGVHQHPEAEEDEISPIDKYGVKSMSIGYLIESGQPLIWRGPMLNKAIEQIIEGTKWGNLDYLFLDLPPGTGDVQISLAQKYRINGALVITTPQSLALEDVRRGVYMLMRTEVPVLGIVENMSYYRCPKCEDVSHPFGENGGVLEAERLNLPLLEKLPLDPKTVELGDRGQPIVLALPESESAKCYGHLWTNLKKRLQELKRAVPEGA